MKAEAIPLNIMIVDDEPQACQNLKNVINRHVDAPVTIIAVANSTMEAEQLLDVQLPDAVFLDIEMPGENAFEFLERSMPLPFQAVFVTAYDEYAVRAFKLNAVDYILKPISVEEVKQAVFKVQERLWYRQNTSLLMDNQPDVANLQHVKDQIVFRESNNMEIVHFTDIYFIEARGSYSTVYFNKNGKEHTVTVSHMISEYEELLPPETFCRIHKSYIVNRRYVKQIIKGDNCTILINANHYLPIGRRRYCDVVAFINNR